MKNFAVRVSNQRKGEENYRLLPIPNKVETLHSAITVLSRHFFLSVEIIFGVLRNKSPHAVQKAATNVVVHRNAGSGSFHKGKSF